jgi:hypothetical protein
LPLCHAIRALHQQHLALEGRIRVQICNFSGKQVCDNESYPTGQRLFSEYINPNNCHLSIPDYYSIITDRSPNALDLDLVNYHDFDNVKIQLSGIIRNVHNLSPNEMANNIQQTLNNRLPNLQLNSFTVINQMEEVNVPIDPQQVNNPN